MSSGNPPTRSPPQAIIFPFMSKGHTIPLLQFARILLHRHVAVTVVTTSGNRPFVAKTLQDTAATVIDLPFPENIADIPSGVESTDKLPSMSLFYTFVNATSLMKPHFDRAVENLPRVSFMVSDAFLWWTVHSASEFGFRRFVFHGMSNYIHAVYNEAFRRCNLFRGPQPKDELVTLPQFPWIQLSKNDFDPAFLNRDPNSAPALFLAKAHSATLESYGRVVNSFYELEPVFVDYVDNEIRPKSWCVGPFCLAEKKSATVNEEKPFWLTWLDRKLEEKCSVIYVAFGSQAEISREQLEEIAVGLEESKVSFVWVMRKDEWGWGLPDGYEERVKERGIVVREWVEQREILMHESVEGFVSHCGWNSVLESVCAGVPILTWPMMADQSLNAKMVEEEIKVGFRVEMCDGSGFVKREGLRKGVRELMEGEKGREAREKVRVLKELARKAVEKDGSSWSSLDRLLHEACELHGENGHDMLKEI